MKLNKDTCKNYAIVYDENNPTYSYAAEELAVYIKKVCGFTLQNGGKAQKIISIGKSLDGYDVDRFTEDEFRIVPKDGNIYIFGGSPRASVYGVYEFIERFLGVRWLNQDGIVLPKKTEFELPETEISAKPYFEQRDFLMWQTIKNPETFMHHRFVSSDGRGEKKHGFRKLWCSIISSSHTSLAYVPKEKYFEKHPEFYCFTQKNDGAEQFFTNVELCYSNGITDDGQIDESLDESVASVVADSLYSFIKGSPEAKYFMFGRQDNRTAICHCARCERRRQEYGNEAGVMVVFLNAVIKRVEEKLKKEGVSSDFGVVTFAYQTTVDPPVVNGKEPVSPLVVPCDRLYIRYAPIDADYTYPMLDRRQKPEIRSQLIGWTALTRNIMIWDYCCNFTEYLWYFPNLWYLKDNLKLYADAGMVYVYNQGSYSINREWQGEMKSYIASKLYWDLSLDVETLKEEYIRGYYGNAADKILAYIAKMDAFFAEKVEKGLHIAILGLKNEYFKPETYPIEFLLEGYELIQSAIDELEASDLPSAEKDEMRMRLYRVLLTPLRMIARNEFDYFPNGNGEYSKRFFALAKQTGLTHTGEGSPLFVDMIVDGKSDYKIVLSQEPTEREKAAAEYLQSRIKDLYGCMLPIVDDDKVYPYYGEKAVCVGSGMMFREFFKGTVDISALEHFTQLCGKCMFVHGSGDLNRTVDIFLADLLSETENGEKKVQIPYIRKAKKL